MDESSNSNGGLPLIQTERVTLSIARPGDYRKILSYHDVNRRHLSPWEPLREKGYFSEEQTKQRLSAGYEDFLQGKGIMFEILSAAIPYIFFRLNIHRIMANYMPVNKRSGALLERLGFEREGIAKAYVQIAGKWEDHVLTSLINSRWRADEGGT